MEIKCTFSCFDWVVVKRVFKHQYTCKVTSAKLTNPVKPIKSFVGVHEEGKCNANVQAIVFFEGAWFDRVNVHCFPRHLHIHFPNLRHLTIEKCGLKEISKQDFRGLERLVHLSIGNSKLSSLPDDLFENMRNLRLIFLNNNRIEFASSKLLEPFVGGSNIKIYLCENKTINAFYDPRQPNSVSSLRELMDMIDMKCMKPSVGTTTLTTTSSLTNKCQKLTRIFCECCRDVQ